MLTGPWTLSGCVTLRSETDAALAAGGVSCIGTPGGATSAAYRVALLLLPSVLFDLPIPLAL